MMQRPRRTTKWRFYLIHRLTLRDTKQCRSEYWKAACGESRLSGLDGGKEREFLPIRIAYKITRTLS